MSSPPITHLTIGNSTTDGTSVVTASVTITSGAPALLAISLAVGSGTTPTVSSLTLPSGVTGAEIKTIEGTQRRVSVWYLEGAGTGTITINCSGTVGSFCWLLDEFLSASPTAPSGGNCVSNTSTGTSITAGLTSLDLDSGAYMVAMCLGSPSYTAKAGFTMTQTRTNVSTPPMCLGACYRADDDDPSPGITLGSSQFWQAISIELQLAPVIDEEFGFGVLG